MRIEKHGAPTVKTVAHVGDICVDLDANKAYKLVDIDLVSGYKDIDLGFVTIPRYDTEANYIWEEVVDPQACDWNKMINKPFGEESNTETVFENREFTIACTSDGEGGLKSDAVVVEGLEAWNDKFNDGDLIVIAINGIEYSAITKANKYGIHEFDVYDDNGGKVCWVRLPKTGARSESVVQINTYFARELGEGEHAFTLSMYRKQTIITPIPEKYLPAMSENYDAVIDCGSNGSPNGCSFVKGDYNAIITKLSPNNNEMPKVLLIHSYTYAGNMYEYKSTASLVYYDDSAPGIFICFTGLMGGDGVKTEYKLKVDLSDKITDAT